MDKEFIIKLVEMLIDSEPSETVNNEYDHYMVGKKAIIRSRDAGVHFGTVVAVDGSKVQLKNSRRMDRFYIAGDEDSLSGVIRHGIIKDKGRICGVIDGVMEINNYCEILPIGDHQAKTIEDAPVWKK